MADMTFTVISAGAQAGAPVIGEIDPTGVIIGSLPLGFVPTKIVMHRKDSDSVSTVATGLLLEGGEAYTAYMQVTAGTRAWATAGIYFTPFAGDQDSPAGVNFETATAIDAADDLVYFEAYY